MPTTTRAWDGRCQRCGRETAVSTGSYFDTSMLCPDCEEAERDHPDYGWVREQEEAAVRRGDYNWPGPGWPGVDGRVKREGR